MAPTSISKDRVAGLRVMLSHHFVQVCFEKHLAPYMMVLPVTGLYHPRTVKLILTTIYSISTYRCQVLGWWIYLHFLESC